jgi:hypothetical protein
MRPPTHARANAAQNLKSEIARWAPLIRATGATVD